MEAGITLKNVIRAVKQGIRCRYIWHREPVADLSSMQRVRSEDVFYTRLTDVGVFALLRGAWETGLGIYELPIYET